jgi:hypothetical protein
MCRDLTGRFDEAAAMAAEARAATAAAGLRRLRRYARSFPMARPRAMAYLGWSHWPTPTTSSAATWPLASAPGSAWSRPSTSTGPGQPLRRSAVAPSYSAPTGTAYDQER